VRAEAGRGRSQPLRLRGGGAVRVQGRHPLGVQDPSAHRRHRREHHRHRPGIHQWFSDPAGGRFTREPGAQHRHGAACRSVRGHRRSHPGRGADAMIDRSLSDPDLQGTIRVISAAATHVGHVRATNEDSVLNAPPIYLVADGMGGHNAGEVASAIAVEEFEKLTIQENVTVEQLGEALRTAVAVLATRVLDGIGYWVVLNLGDSRVYRLSKDIFEQVTVDHSVVQELMDRGELTSDEARVHPYRHMVTRALGAGPEADPDYW